MIKNWIWKIIGLLIPINKILKQIEISAFYFSSISTTSHSKNLNSISSKTTPMILISSLLISTFYDTHFSIQLYTIYPTSQHLPTRGYIKTITLSSPKRLISSNLTLKFNLPLRPTNLPTKPSKLKFTLKIINLLYRFHIANSMYSNKNSPYD